MKAIDGPTLAGMTISILERTAMVLAEPAAHEEAHPPPTRFARITYQGPSRGTLLLGATDGFLRELAASLLGAETAEVDLDTQGGDALKEMANIVGGSVILALSGGACEYSLGLPELLPSPEAPEGTPAARAEGTVVTEGGPLHVVWRDGSAPVAA